MKRNIIFLLVIIAGFFLQPRLWAQAKAVLLVRTDMECKWSLDGEQKGVLKTGDRSQAEVAIGQHLIEATSTDGLIHWEKTIDIKEPKMQTLEIQLESLRPTWTDHQTGLMWEREDNGTDVNWNQAGDYCRNLTLGGYSNWRLPTIYELAEIYDPTQKGKGLRIKGGIRLSGTWSWSSTAGYSSEAWSFLFLSGERKSQSLFIKRYGRALCVRRAGE
jgi:hypothetical protein